MYREELDKALTLMVEVGEMVNTLRNLHEKYPHLVRACFMVLYGVSIKTDLECPHCGKSISLTAQHPVGGLIDACEAVDEAYVLLTLEAELEEVDSDAVEDSEDAG